MISARNKRRLERRHHLRHVDAAITAAMVDRPCGECTACCTAMGVAELKKPVGVECRHVCKTGCGIYTKRPVSCREFNCVWRYGLLDLEHRPDKIGIVFDVTGDNPTGIQMLVARQLWDGAFDAARALLDRLVEEGHVLILVENAKGPRRLMGTPDKLAFIREHIQLREVNERS